MNNAKNNKYGFLFRRSALRKARLSQLIVTEEFIKAADDFVANGRKINDIDIYNISKSLFFPLLKEHLSEGFKEEYKSKYGNAAYKEWSRRYRVFGQATKSFSEDLFHGEERWKDDFEEYLSAVSKE